MREAVRSQRRCGQVTVLVGATNRRSRQSSRPCICRMAATRELAHRSHRRDFCCVGQAGARRARVTARLRNTQAATRSAAFCGARSGAPVRPSAAGPWDEEGAPPKGA